MSKIKTCGECQYFDTCNVEPGNDICKDFEPIPPPTNGDLLRQKERGIMDNLKPCPFCGSAVSTSHINSDTYGVLYEVKCRYCGVSGGQFIFEHYAIKAWNSRPSEEALKVKLDKLKAALNYVRQNAELHKDEDASLLALIYRVVDKALTTTGEKGARG